MSNWSSGASRPVADKQVTTTFAESFVTVSNADVVGESLEPPVEPDGSPVTWSVSGTANNTAGLFLQFSEDVLGVEVTAGPSLTIGSVELQSADGGTSYDSKTMLSNDTKQLMGDIPAGTEVRVVTLNAEDHDYGEGPDKTNGITTITDGYYNGGRDTNNLRAFTSVEPIIRKDVSAIVEFDAPNDVFGWDVASFTRSLPGNSAADVFVEDTVGNELAGPISRGDTIPADPTENPRFRVDFTTDGDNVPTLDSLARRWKL